MEKVFLEYIWLDGNEPQQLRSKTKVFTYEENKTLNLDIIPSWSFDGSSTKQAKAGNNENTDCVLKPVYMVPDPFRGGNNKLVFCSVFKPDGVTPHETNGRYKLNQFFNDNTKLLLIDNKVEEPWFGWEQEYTLMTKESEHPFGEGEGLPLGHKSGELVDPRPQGDYYCGVGSDNVIGRSIAEEHLMLCAYCGINISGINAEVMLGQWEYQVGPVTTINGSDQLWVSRYILQRIAERNRIKVSFHPKPKSGEWNGSGCHVNFSTPEMRREGGLDVILDVMEKLKLKQTEHIEVYGLENDKRMTGELETSNLNEFSWGYSTRDTSIRIPIQTKIDGKGYFEDRRPASNCDPYLVSLRMLETVYNTVLETETAE